MRLQKHYDKNDLINDAFDNGLNDNNKSDVDALLKKLYQVLIKVYKSCRKPQW